MFRMIALIFYLDIRFTRIAFVQETFLNVGVRKMELRTPESAKVISVIETKSTRGDGTSASPVRTVYQYWSLDGVLLAEKDEINDLD